MIPEFFPTQLCRVLGIRHPVIQAAMGGGLAPARLAAAVSNAGGLGTIGTVGTPPDWWEQQISEARELTDRPFAVNVLLGQDYGTGAREQLVETCLRHGVPAIMFGGPGAERFFGPFKDAGIRILHQVATVADARRSADAGVDVIIAQAAEAGGHLLGGISALPLVPQVAAAVSPVPVALAGGVADGRGLAAALVLGAQGVVLGTRLLASEEAAAHPVYKQRLLEAASDEVTRTAVYDEEWPNQDANILRAPTVAAWLDRVIANPGAKEASRDPVARSTVGNTTIEIRRFSTATATDTTVGDIDELPLYMGQCVGLVTAIKPAGEIVDDVVREARDVIVGVFKGIEECIR